MRHDTDAYLDFPTADSPGVWCQLSIMTVNIILRTKENEFELELFGHYWSVSREMGGGEEAKVSAKVLSDLQCLPRSHSVVATVT